MYNYLGRLLFGRGKPKNPFLHQKFEFRDNQSHRWIRLALARRSVLSNLCWGTELVKRNSIEKQVAKSSKNDDFATPRKHTSFLRRNFSRQWVFLRKKIAGTKNEKSHLSWKKTYLAGGEFYTKSYVGNTPRKDHFLIIKQLVFQLNSFLSIRLLLKN